MLPIRPSNLMHFLDNVVTVFSFTGFRFERPKDYSIRQNCRRIITLAPLTFLADLDDRWFTVPPDPPTVW
jgi:hypothetical protein